MSGILRPVEPWQRQVFLPHVVLPGFLGADHRRALLDWAIAQEPRFAPARMTGGVVDPAQRASVNLRDLGQHRATIEQAVAARLPDLFAGLRLAPFAPDRYEIELVAHLHGAHLQLHSDVHPELFGKYADRRLSAVYYFHREPKAFAGGHLRFHPLGAKHGDAGRDIVPENDSLVVFPSLSPHSVTPVECPSRVFADARFAINCWVYRAAGG